MILFLFIAALVVVLDHLTKWIVVQQLPFDHNVHVLGEWVMLTHIKNTGAAFGLFPGSIAPLIVISLGASIVVFVLALKARHHVARIIPLGLILGGAIGNLIDRLSQGRVTDFINIGFPGGARWPVFNVADSAVTIGVAILAFGVYFRHEAEPAAEAPPAGSDAAPPPGQFSTAVAAAAPLGSTPPVPAAVTEPRPNALPGEPG